MAQITNTILKQLWYATPDSTWSSLLSGLKEIYQDEVIDYDQYETLEYAIEKVSSYGTDFPDSVGELYQLLDPHM